MKNALRALFIMKSARSHKTHSDRRAYWIAAVAVTLACAAPLAAADFEYTCSLICSRAFTDYGGDGCDAEIQSGDIEAETAGATSTSDASMSCGGAVTWENLGVVTEDARSDARNTTFEADVRVGGSTCPGISVWETPIFESGGKGITLDYPLTFRDRVYGGAKEIKLKCNARCTSC